MSTAARVRTPAAVGNLEFGLTDAYRLLAAPGRQESAAPELFPVAPEPVPPVADITQFSDREIFNRSLELRKQRRAQVMAANKGRLEIPMALRPLDSEGRKLRLLHNKAENRLMLVIGPKHDDTNPFVETWDFEGSPGLIAELPKTEAEAASALLAKLNAGQVRPIENGYWGDMRGPWPDMQPLSNGWTKIGSPDWLAEVFGSLEPNGSAPTEPLPT